MTKKNVVRVFVSSTFTDTETERNRLMADVYPYLNLLCKKIGLEFETVDMRWVCGSNKNEERHEGLGRRARIAM